MSDDGAAIQWTVNCEAVVPGRLLDSPDAVREEVAPVLDRIGDEHGADLRIVESADEVRSAPGGSEALVVDFVVQVAAGVSTALIVETLRERRETERAAPADDGDADPSE
jgi:hypothetical protein